MNKTIVLVLMTPEDENAAAYRRAVESSPALQGRVELRFAASDAARDVIQDAEVVVCSNVSPELFAVAPKLRWISYWSAGLEGKVTPEMEARNILVTNASGVHGPNIAEHVLAFMLMFTRRMPQYMRAQMAGQWRHDNVSQTSGVGELSGQTLGIAGFGRIGEALAVRARSFGMRIVATKRDPSRRYDSSVRPDALYPAADLPRLLAESDHVCIALPLTKETHHLFGERALAHMRPGSYLYNISRGKIVDEGALISALRGGRLAGAGLDVFENEPLPPESPLWRMENVIITPHVAGLTPFYFERAAALFAANLERYIKGQPLSNLYHSERGY